MTESNAIFDLRSNCGLVSETSTQFYDWIKIEEQTSTNIGSLSQYNFSVRNIDEFCVPHDSYFLVQAQIVATNGTTPSTLTNAFLSSLSLFKQIKYMINGETVEDRNNVAETQYLMQNLEMSKENLATQATNGYIYPENGAGGHVVDEYTTKRVQAKTAEAAGNDVPNTWAIVPAGANPTYNKSFHERVLRCHETVGGDSKLVTFFVPATLCSEFLKQYNRVSFGLKHQFMFYKNTPERALLGTATTDNKFNITKFQWYMPIVRPSLILQNQLYAQLSSNSVFSVKFHRIQHEQSQHFAEGATALTWRVSSLGEKAIKAIFYAQRVANEEAFNRNNLIANDISTTSVSLRFNSQIFPQEPYEDSFASGEYVRLYQAYINACEKQHDVDSSVPISYEEYKTLMPVYHFDLSHQSEKLFESGLSDLTIDLRRTDNGGGEFRLHMVVFYEKELKLNLASGKMQIHG